MPLTLQHIVLVRCSAFPATTTGSWLHFKHVFLFSYFKIFCGISAVTATKIWACIGFIEDPCTRLDVYVFVLHAWGPVFIPLVTCEQAHIAVVHVSRPLVSVPWSASCFVFPLTNQKSLLCVWLCLGCYPDLLKYLWTSMIPDSSASSQPCSHNCLKSSLGMFQIGVI